MVGIALVSLLGAINQWTGGGFVTLLNNGGKVLEAFGRAIGSLIGGFVSGFVGPVGDALKSLSEGIAGFGDNDNLDEDIEKTIEAVKSIGEFVTTLQDMDVETNPGLFKRFFEGENKTNSLLQQIKEFGETMGTIKTGAAGNIGTG